MKLRSKRRKGSATLEMTFVGIPLIFVIISIFEMARGMWIYHTLAYSLKEGTRYTIVHGANCDPKINTSNNCQVTVAQIAQVIQKAGIGLEGASLQVRMQSTVDDTGMAALSSLLTNNTIFPTNPGNLAQSPVTFTAQYPFLSAISMFWPGAGKGISFQNLTCSGPGTFCLPATSQERIQF